MVVAVIIACEVLFWVFIVAGLSARYLLRRRRLGAALLALAPVTDVLLLATTAIDLAGGATATAAHGIAAIYLGLSVAYGDAMIRWADIRFAHRFADGPAPIRRTGADYTRACWRDVLRTLLGAAIAAGVIGLLILVAGDPERSQAVAAFLPILCVVVGIDALWAVSYTIWPRPAPRTGATY
ncbi:hypothetical protein [Leifsonia sp. LS1]|uniref:hypothetical protein n=1 Tax=Leifsonia sp. LS1 TaxID=2828483 RepID=UPI001CFE6D46|nr:hypothetical protein [Leifsonia sp. LS1]